MRNRELQAQLQRIESLISRTVTACGGDVEMQSHWARYLCVLSAGFLENAISEIYSDFVRSSAGGPVVGYACSQLGKIQNPKTKRFVETARSFRPQWAVDLEIFASEEGRGEAVDSIMNNRNQIAHGKSVGVTVARIDQYLRKSIELLEFIESQCRP